MQIATIGFRTKTARAIAIALMGNASPDYLARWEVALHDPKAPATKQPHHEVMELSWAEAQSAVQPLERRIEVVAASMLEGLLIELRARGYKVSGIGVVGSPDRKLDRIGNPHIRAHAAEGVLYRRAIETAAARHQLQCRGFSDRDFEELAFPQLRRKPQEIRKTLEEIGKKAGRPWRTDERAAAIAAWLMIPD